jgi:hypothetical protein
MSHRFPSPRIIVLGAGTCASTAIIRNRLDACGIPYGYVDVERDREALARVRRLNGGRRVTPTLIFGTEDFVAADPSIESLAVLLPAAGYRYDRPSAVEVNARLAARWDELSSGVALPAARPVALFLSHGAGCLSCFGYARQLACQVATFVEGASAVVVLVDGPSGRASAWRDELGTRARVVDGAVAAAKVDVARALEASTDAAMLLIVDRSRSLRAASIAPEAGGLIDPADAADWLRSLELEVDCSEGPGEIDSAEAALVR